MGIGQHFSFFFRFLLGAVLAGHAWDDILAHSRSPVKLMTDTRGSASGVPADRPLCGSLCFFYEEEGVWGLEMGLWANCWVLSLLLGKTRQWLPFLSHLGTVHILWGSATRPLTGTLCCGDHSEGSSAFYFYYLLLLLGRSDERGAKPTRHLRERSG